MCKLELGLGNILSYNEQQNRSWQAVVWPKRDAIQDKDSMLELTALVCIEEMPCFSVVSVFDGAGMCLSLSPNPLPMRELDQTTYG